MDYLKEYRNTTLFPLQATNAQKRVVKDLLKDLFNNKQDLTDQALEYITGKRTPADEDYIALLTWMNPQDGWEAGKEVTIIDPTARRILLAAPALLMQERGQLTMF